MRLIYLAHPLGAPTPEGVEANKARARRWIRWIYDHLNVGRVRVAVVADWLITCDVLDDFNPDHRSQGMTMNKAIIPVCHEFWMVGGRVSSGMEEEWKLVRNLIASRMSPMKRYFDLTWLGDEPPAVMPDEVKALVA
jgi:hypothetical protein